MEIAVFNKLEEKIGQLLNRLESLKSENTEMKRLLDEKEREVLELNELLATQDSERQQVKQRLEILVAKLEEEV